MLDRHEPSPSQSKKNNDNRRSDFLKLPQVERRRILREQAKRLLAAYQGNPDTSGMGGGDLVDY